MEPASRETKPLSTGARIKVAANTLLLSGICHSNKTSTGSISVVLPIILCEERRVLGSDF